MDYAILWTLPRKADGYRFAHTERRMIREYTEPMAKGRAEIEQPVRTLQCMQIETATLEPDLGEFSRHSVDSCWKQRF